MISKTLRDAWRFFLDNAGYATPPGRAACALDLAKAELRAKDEGLTFSWVEDDSPDTSWMDDRQRKDYEEGRLLILGCYAEEAGLNLPYNAPYAVSLWGISVYGWDDPYCRVVETELASEAFTMLDAEAAEEAGIHRDPVPS